MCLLPFCIFCVSLAISILVVFAFVALGLVSSVQAGNKVFNMIYFMSYVFYVKPRSINQLTREGRFTGSVIMEHAPVSFTG